MKSLKVKVSLNISGHIESKNDLDFNIQSEFFYENNYSVKIYFDLEEKINNYLISERKIFYKSLNKLNFEISSIDENSYSHLFDYIQNNKLKLYRFLLKLINFTLTHIRNNAFTPYITKIPFKEDKFLYYLWSWETKVSTEMGVWSELVEYQNDFLVETFMNNINFKRITVRAARWPYIDLALKFDLPVLFQYELVTNTYEFIWQNNFRIAYVECINALEIVLSAYTETFYNRSNLFEELSKSEREYVEGYINGPDFSLFAKVITTLFLTCEAELKYISFKNILKAIKIRNNIVHRKGSKIPLDVTENSEIITNVLILIFLLTNKIQQLSQCKEFLDISNDVNDKNKDIKLVFVKKESFLIAEALYFFPEFLRKDDFIIRLVDYINFKVKRIQNDFDVNKSFILIFKGLFNEVNYIWEKGILREYN